MPNKSLNGNEMMNKIVCNYLLPNPWPKPYRFVRKSWITGGITVNTREQHTMSIYVPPIHNFFSSNMSTSGAASRSSISERALTLQQTSQNWR